MSNRDLAQKLVNLAIHHQYFRYSATKQAWTEYRVPADLLTKVQGAGAPSARQMAKRLNKEKWHAKWPPPGGCLHWSEDMIRSALHAAEIDKALRALLEHQAAA